MHLDAGFPELGELGGSAGGCPAESFEDHVVAVHPQIRIVNGGIRLRHFLGVEQAEGNDAAGGRRDILGKGQHVPADNKAGGDGDGFWRGGFTRVIAGGGRLGADVQIADEVAAGGGVHGSGLGVRFVGAKGVAVFFGWVWVLSVIGG